MSIRIMSACWTVPDLRPTGRLVLLALADHANDHGICWPSIPRVAEMVQVDESTVRRWIRVLEDRGLVDTKLGGGRSLSSRYKILPGALAEKPRQDARVSGTETPASVPETPASAPETRVLGPAEPSITVKKHQWWDELEHPPAPGWAPLTTPWTFSTPDGTVDELWDTLVQVCRLDRTSITKTERGRLNAALRDLRDVGATPGDVRQRAAEYRRLMPDAQLTATGLAANWSRLVPVVEQTRRRRCPPHPWIDMGEEDRGRWCPACKTWEKEEK